MAPYTLFSLLALTGAVVATTPVITPAPTPSVDLLPRQAQATSTPPLFEYRAEHKDLPYQVNPVAYGRGPQFGFNQCNSTTEGPDSNCQTLIMNSLDDFCIWGSPTANSHMGDVEAKTVVYCTKKGWGGRVMPAGTITGAHFIRTSEYIQITGRLKQENIGLTPTDLGGELDPHGQDLLGNPIGGVVYSKGMPSGDNSTLKQVPSWNNFVGSGLFCIKLCTSESTKEPFYCEHKYDIIGCEYNMPGNYEDGTFTDCQGDLQDVVGVYTRPDGVTTTWTFTYPNAGVIPYTPRIPSSSQCRTFSSAELYGAASTASASASGSQASVTGTASGTRSGTSGTASRSGSGASASATGQPNAAIGVRASGVLALIGAFIGVMVVA